MARIDAFTGLSEFVTVAAHASFRAAAAELHVTPGAVSQAVRALEARVGLPLFQRTTRSVSLTEVGAHLLARLRPATTEIGEALEELATLRQRPAGHLRLSVPHIALDLVILMDRETPPSLRASGQGLFGSFTFGVAAAIGVSIAGLIERRGGMPSV